MSAESGAESETGFVIRDRRGSRPDEGDRSPLETPTAAAAPASAAQTTPGSGDTHEEHAHMPVTFSSFVFSMGTSALMLMGETLDPKQAPVSVNLGQAKEIIDILSILETKTKGNLTGEEQSIMTEMLYTLRMKFVELTSGKSTAPSR
ncbi:hypothetical protein YTPLAS18_11550 [Nitrospira sp.]|nr:hypothetical protein YTPLAS18_11550 [Nitrospira sp.]